MLLGIIIGFGSAVVAGLIIRARAQRQIERFYEQLGVQLDQMAENMSKESTLVIENHDGTYFAYRKHDMQFMFQFNSKDELVAKLKEINPERTWLTDKDSLEVVKGLK